MLYDDPLAADLRSWLDRPAPRLLVLEAAPAAEPRLRLARLLGDLGADARWVRPDPGGGPAARRAMLASILRNTPPPDPGPARSDPDPARSDPGWMDIWGALREGVAAVIRDAVTGSGPHPWVLDDAHHLPGAAWEPLLHAWAGIRGQAIPVHLVVVASPDLSDRLAEVPHDRLRVDPLPSASWLTRETAWSAADRVRAAAIFGGSPTLHAAVDPSRSVGRNVRSLLLARDAPYATRALEAVRSGPQRPERYLQVVRALAAGHREWGDVREAVAGLSSSGQLGPYMKSLEELGLVVGDRSLDAPARSRSRRWRVADAHMAFWFSCVLPTWDRLGVADGKRLWTDEVLPRLDAHVGRTLPALIREWLFTPSATSVLGSRAREAGGLWGDGYDIDVAATLRNGAIVYAWTRWDGGFTPDEVEARLEQVRRTRFGFGRENRFKLFIQRDPPRHELTRLDARDPEVVVLGVDGLGVDGPGGPGSGPAAAQRPKPAVAQGPEPAPPR